MYLEFFRFERPPFNLTPDSRFLYLSERHREALASLEYGITGRKGFIVLTGDIGAGKTTLCRSLLKRLGESTKVALILNSFLTDVEILQTINDELGAQYANATSKKALIDALNTALIRECAAGNDVLVIIDEAQNLSPASLEQVRMLSNLETESEKLLQILLMGQPELRDTLKLPQLEQLNQRVTVRFHLPPLSRDEVREYLYHRMGVAGPENNAEFDDEALEAIWEFSQGVPRKINLVADRALLGGYAAQCHIINREMVEQAVVEVAGEAAETESHEILAELKDGEPEAELEPVVAAAAAAPVAQTGAAFVPQQTPVYTAPGAPPGYAPAPGFFPYPSTSPPGYPQGYYSPQPMPSQPVMAGPYSAPYPDPGQMAASAAAAPVRPARSGALSWFALFFFIILLVVGGVAAAIYWPPPPRPEPQLSSVDTSASRRILAEAAAASVPIAAASGAVSSETLATAVPEPTNDGAPVAAAGADTPQPAPVEPWSVDKDGLVRVTNPRHFALANELNLLRHRFEITINARRFGKLDDSVLSKLSVLNLPELKQRHLRKATLSGGLDAAIELGHPVVLRIDSPEGSRLSPVLLLLRTDSDRAMIGDPLNGMGRLPLDALRGIFRAAEVYYFDDDNLGNLKDGDSGSSVEKLERILSATGSWPPNTGQPDGRFALFTSQAIKRFQRERRLPVNGQLDGATVFALLQAAEELGSGDEAVSPDTTSVQPVDEEATQSPGAEVTADE